MKIKKILYLILMIALLCGCDVRKEDKSNDIEIAYKQFINQFSKGYPGFKLVDLKKGSAQNYPIFLVAIGENRQDGISSTLFIVDEDGTGEVILADNKGIYRKEDGLVLDKNNIFLSLTLMGSHQNEEIHDFKITVTKENNQGKFETLYTNEEIIRK